VVAKLGRLSISKQVTEEFDMERFSRKKLNDAELKVRYREKFCSRNAALINSDDNSNRSIISYNIIIKIDATIKLVRLTEMILSETHSKVRVCKYFFVAFPVQNGLKQDDLSPTIFKLH
jgi:hypothetical protein